MARRTQNADLLLDADPAAVGLALADIRKELEREERPSQLVARLRDAAIERVATAAITGAVEAMVAKAEPARAAWRKNLVDARKKKSEKIETNDKALKRQASLLRRLEGLSKSQTAKRLGCSRRKVAKLLGKPWQSISARSRQ